jgi:hypothetical protein
MFAAADIVVGVHGAGLANILFCKPAAFVIELAVPQQHNHYYAYLAAAMQLRYRSLRLKGRTAQYAQYVSHLYSEDALEGAVRSAAADIKIEARVQAIEGEGEGEADAHAEMQAEGGGAEGGHDDGQPPLEGQWAGGGWMDV